MLPLKSWEAAHIDAVVKDDAGGRRVGWTPRVPNRSRYAGGPGRGAHLQQSERRFQTALENAGTGMCLTAPDGAFLEVNRALCDMLGYSEQELTARDFASVTHPEDLAISRECVRCLLAGERSVYRFEKRYLGRDGDNVWADVSTSSSAMRTNSRCTSSRRSRT